METLSDKRNTIDDNFNVTYLEKDVKEFIKDLKNELDEHWDKFDETTIDKLAGDKLI